LCYIQGTRLLLEHRIHITQAGKPTTTEVRIMFSITLDVPSELSTPLSISGYNREKLTEEAKQLLAISLFERNILSLGQAAKLAELHLWDFIQLLSQQDIPIADYDDEETQQELKTIKCLIQQTQ
jgi:predicted HTH domain antitoxin